MHIYHNHAQLACFAAKASFSLSNIFLLWCFCKLFFFSLLCVYISSVGRLSKFRGDVGEGTRQPAQFLGELQCATNCDDDDALLGDYTATAVGDD